MMKALLTLTIVMLILFVVYAAERLLDRYGPRPGCGRAS